MSRLNESASGAGRSVKGLTVASWIIAVLAMGGFLWASVSLMTGPDFNDETEKLIASQLMLQGQRLYKDIFVQHGPFVYMLSHLFDLVTGNRELFWPRLIPIALSLLAIAAVAASPGISGVKARLWAATLTAIAFGMLLALYSLVMTMYQVYSGYLFTIALALGFIPAILGISLRRWHLIVCGAALAAMALNAISFGVAIALTCVALASAYLPDWREVGRVVGWTITGALVLVAIVSAWIMLFADFAGLFIDHIYINLTAYRHYLAGQSFTSPFRLLLPWQPWFTAVPPGHSSFEQVVYSMPVFAMAALLAVALAAGKRRWWHTAAVVSVLFVGIAYTNPRFALGFGASTYVIVVSALVVLVGLIAMRAKAGRWPALALIGVFLAAGAVAQSTVPTSLYGVSVATYYSTRGPLYQRDEAEFALARTIVGEDEGLLQVPFDLYRYVWAGRNPASGVFFWMPWMHDYGLEPILGYKLDICADTERTRPKIIYFNDFPVWNNPTDKWMACLKDIISTQYVRVGALGEMAMVRADVVASRPDLLETALVTNDLDLSRVTTVQATTLLGAALSFGEMQQNGFCLTEAGTLGGDGRIASDPCNVDPPITIVARSGGLSAIVDDRTGLCLEIRNPSGFAACSINSAEQAFTVLSMPDATNEIRSGLEPTRCVGTPAAGFAVVACSANVLWKNPERQEFAIRPVDNFQSEIVSKSTGWCMEVAGGSQLEGAGLRLWPCTGGASQHFYVKQFEGTVELRNVFSDRCVAMRDATVSQQICDETTRLSFIIQD